MNRSTPSLHEPKLSLSISKSIDGFLKFKITEGLSPKTIATYQYALEKMVELYKGSKHPISLDN